MVVVQVLVQSAGSDIHGTIEGIAVEINKFTHWG